MMIVGFASKRSSWCSIFEHAVLSYTTRVAIRLAVVALRLHFANPAGHQARPHVAVPKRSVQQLLQRVPFCVHYTLAR